MFGKVNLGLNIEAARRLAWFSQRELAKKIGVSQVTLCQYENGGMNCPVDRLEQIAEACNVPLDHLTEREWDRVEHRFKEHRTYLEAARRGNKSGTVLLVPTSKHST